jgi:DNA helicase-2/ATP-dependent DNA helicase PcrA
MTLTPRAGRSADALGRLIDPAKPPTPEQQAVIEAPAEPLRVIAGAGSGKTETMATRVLWLLDNYDLRPEDVLCLTFTRKAAGEIADRVRRHLGRLRSADAEADAVVRFGTGPAGLGLGEPTMATYNSYAAGLVKEHGLRLGVDPDAALLSEAGQWQLVSQLVESWTAELSVDGAGSTVTAAVISLAKACHEHLREPAEVQNEIRALAAALRVLPRAVDGSVPGKPYGEVTPVLASLDARADLMDLVQAFRRAKSERSVLDYGDQVAIAARLAALPAVAEAERSRYRVVLLDEFQDTSYAQLQLLARLFGSGHPVTAVGDPNQAIYGWRGASAAGMDDFLTAFRGRDGKAPRTLTLSVSWRNPASILELANTVAAPLRSDAHRDLPILRSREAELGLPEAPAVIRAEYPATLEEEARIVVDYLREQWHEPNATCAEGGRLSAAVLCRTRAQFRPIIDALRDAGLPYEVVGLGGLLDTPEVVDLVAALEVAHDPSRGDSLMRLLTGERLMLGAADLAALGDWSRELAHADHAATATATDAAIAGETDAATAGETEAALAAPLGAPIVVDADVVDERSLVDALDALPGPHWRSHSGRELSEPGSRRLHELAATIRAIRSQTYLSVPDVVLAAERLLGLDIELMARPQREVWRARTHLDTLVNVAHDFAGSADRATLGAFLSWLDAAREHERGLEVAPAEPAPGSLQILTVHAAKGLESLSPG